MQCLKTTLSAQFALPFCALDRLKIALYRKRTRNRAISEAENLYNIDFSYMTSLRFGQKLNFGTYFYQSANVLSRILPVVANFFFLFFGHLTRNVDIKGPNKLNSLLSFPSGINISEKRVSHTAL